MENYEGLSVNRATKTVRAHKGHREQRSGRVQVLICLLKDAPSARLAMDLQEELEYYIDKTNDISAGLQCLIMHDNSKEGLGKYRDEKTGMGEEDTDLILRAKACSPWASKLLRLTWT